MIGLPTVLWRAFAGYVICMSLTCVFAISTVPAAASQPRREYNFNSGWQVFVGDPSGAESVEFDDSAWKPVALPYGWNEDDAFRLSIADLPVGVAWYRKHFRLPSGSGGKKAFLEFEGVRFAAEVWVNGRNVGLHENGVMAFGLDISDAVYHDGKENVIAVRTDSSWRYRERETQQSYQWNDRNFNVPYGGINKNVTLHVADKLYQTLPLYSNLGTTGLYVYADDFDIPSQAATVSVEAQVRNEHDRPQTFDFEVALRDPDGKVVATFTGPQQRLNPGQTTIVKASHRIEMLNFWSWGYGYLYDVDTTLIVDGQPIDVVTTRTGFRTTEFGYGAFKLNDHTLHLKGYAQRTTNEWPGVGVNIPPWLSDFSNRMIVEGNGNLIRWMHVTPSKQDVESCDRVGLLQAMPAGDSESDVKGRRWEQRVLLMRDAIIYNRNNPSVIFYEAGNKGISESHMQEMIALRDAYDPHGGRAMGCREMLGSATAEWGGEMLYINKSATKPLWMTEYSRDEGLRKWWDEYSPPFHKEGEGKGQGASYNRNQDAHAIENVVRWYDYWRERPGTGRRVNAGGVNIIFSDTNTHHRGSENYRRSGEVDAMRLPKEGYFAHQVIWNGWVDVEKPAVHLMGHWNYEPGTTKTVDAVSSTDKVELFLNGKSLGFGQQSHRFLFTFPNIEWKPGKITVVAYDTSAKKVAEDSHETAGEPHSIRLTPHIRPGGLLADHADLALIDVEVCDAEGRRCPTALHNVAFELTGPAEWRGGIAQGKDNYILARTLPVECGVNRVLVRSTTEAGTIRLRASSDGLKPADIDITSHAADVQDGWLSARPNLDPPSYLGRGPTPPAEPLELQRIPIAIAFAKAGGGNDRAELSFDDDETTTWDNQGGVSTAWIRYDFEQPARVSEVTMKLADWRNRSYPIRILVDDHEVFQGDSPRGLGYVTFSFPPVEGHSLRVELQGASTEGDAFSDIVEVADSTPADANASSDVGSERDRRSRRNGTLRIVELEAYAPCAPVTIPK